MGQALPKNPDRGEVQLPEKLKPLFDPHRYKVAYGGRGGAKSHTFAKALLIIGTMRPTRILCTRELQNSISESVHLLLSDQIEQLGLGHFYTITKDSITGLNGTKFLFMGVKNNVTKVKSTEGIDICWVEEAEKVSHDSWEVLIPTVRKPNSEIWVSFNPNQEDDSTYQRFVVNTPPDTFLIKINYGDNPWFPEELRKEMEYLRRVDIDAHDHVWLGNCKAYTEAQIFKGKFAVEEFEGQSTWDGPYYGADWGFAEDPSVMVKFWIVGKMLAIEYEAWGLQIEIDHLPELFDKIPGAKTHVCRADSARPETISFMQRNNYPKMISVSKWSGSVEDGVEFMRSFEKIVIHPRCTHTLEEMKLYSYKVDKNTGDILPVIVDKHNHCIDSVRYGLTPYIQQRSVGTSFAAGHR